MFLNSELYWSYKVCLVILLVSGKVELSSVHLVFSGSPSCRPDYNRSVPTASKRTLEFVLKPDESN